MKLKKPNHIGIIVRDLAEATTRYGKMFGIKNWYEINSTDLDILYEGQHKKCDVRLYYGGKGSTKIELLESKGEANIYDEFLATNGEGIHHIMYNVKDLEKAMAEYENMGYKVLQIGTFNSAGAKIKYAYVGKNKTDTIIEIVETKLFGKINKGDMPFEIPIGLLTGSYKKVK